MTIPEDLSFENKKTKVIREFAEVINRNSLENNSDTPDFILAEYLWDCLETFAETSNRRQEWYGKKLTIGGVKNLSEEK